MVDGFAHAAPPDGIHRDRRSSSLPNKVPTNFPKPPRPPVTVALSSGSGRVIPARSAVGGGSGSTGAVDLMCPGWPVPASRRPLPRRELTGLLVSLIGGGGR